MKKAIFSNKASWPLLLVLLSCLNVYGQKDCNADRINRLFYESQPEFFESRKLVESIVLEQNSANARDVEVHTIPIVVHVLHIGEAIGVGNNISDQQIYEAIDHANELWRNTNSVGADMKIQFCLAQRDPQGNPSTGINRVDASIVPNYLSEGIAHFGDPGGASELAVKNLSNWPHNFAYNIWVVNDIAGGSAGYAYYPIFIDFPLDGTTIESRFMKKNYNTLAHEFGHGFNLLHTHGENGDLCDANTNCQGQGDKVCDTAPHKTYDCLLTECAPNDELFENSRKNFMSYCSGDDRFTQGQVDRARASLNNSARRLLKNSKACLPPLSTGIEDQALAEQIKIYPNPSKGLFKIELPSGLNKDNLILQIYDELGRQNRFKSIVRKDNNTIEIDATLSKGVYHLHFTDEESIIGSKRLIIF